MVEKYSGVTRRLSACGLSDGLTGWPATVKSAVPQNPVRGRKLIAAADCTPGNLLRFSITPLTNASRFCGWSLGYLLGGRKTSIARVFSVRIPRFSPHTRRKLSIVKPAPVSSSRDRAISETTRAYRTRAARKPEATFRPDSFIASLAWIFEDWSAGTALKARAARTVIPSANHSAGPLTGMASILGI